MVAASSLRRFFSTPDAACQAFDLISPRLSLSYYAVTPLLFRFFRFDAAAACRRRFSPPRARFSLWLSISPCCLRYAPCRRSGTLRESLLMPMPPYGQPRHVLHAACRRHAPVEREPSTEIFCLYFICAVFLHHCLPPPCCRAMAIFFATMSPLRFAELRQLFC